jgi:hypothetical protein
MADIMRDMYPQPGERIKQWVVDTRRESEWERATCPRFPMYGHDDNTGIECRNSRAVVPWTWLEGHDCCYVCNDIGDGLRDNADVQRWQAERAARPPIEADRDRLSDEVEGDWMSAHGLFDVFKPRRG